ncbi:MAG: ABC transporter permease [Actinomycetia bacterium]|nr:ABC transporter permease [Actinomycetes bacterium]
MSVQEGTAHRPWVDRILTINGWLIFGFLYLPIVILVIYSFSDSKIVGVWGGFTLRWYDRMLGNPEMMGALGNSIKVALISTVIATILGTMAALALDRYRKWLGKGAFDVIMYMPVIIPEVTMGAMLLIWFTQVLPINLSIWTIILGHIAFSASFVTIIVRARLANLDDSLEEAARDLYANRRTTFRRVTLPLIMPGVMGGALLALTLSLDDVIITEFVQGPGASLLPVYVFGLIKRQVTPEINAVSTLMLSISMVLVFVSLGFQARSRSSKGNKEE